jgi:CubicO group peptidase (beta-lactamase class C family)
MGLNKITPIKTDGLKERINSVNAQLINRQLVENALTLVKNDSNIVPITNLETKKIACISIGDREQNDFQNMINLYADVQFFNISATSPKSHFDKLVGQLSAFDVVIAGINNTNRAASKKYGITQETIDFIDTLSQTTKVILDVFANAYSLSLFENAKNVKSILMSYEDSKNAQELSAQLIFGGIPALGKLPVTASPSFKEGDGIIIDRKIRLKYSMPEELAISSVTLNKIDSIAISGIKEKAYPGCQVLVAKDGVVIYQKSFGYQIYEDKKNPVKNTDLYDLASVSKIASTTISLMKLTEENKIDLNEKMSTYLPYLNNSNKKDLIIKEVLAHKSGLAGWIPFWQKTVKKGEYIAGLYSKNMSEDFPIKVADSLFLNKNYKDTIFANIAKSALLEKKEYKYSDLGMILFSDMIEKLSNQKLNDFVASNFYAPLGAKTLGYKPLERFDKSIIAPTQNDLLFRKQLVQGYVHDPAAALLGGVSGNAGVFSNANDLAKLMQMLLQNGEYGDKQYFKKETVDLFTSCAFCAEGNKRGLGFDKPIPNFGGGTCCKSASNASYGHSGFTGTLTWVDPIDNLVYVFLSNRVYPDEENKKIQNLNIRTQIQQVIYDAIKESKKGNSVTDLN